MQAHESDGENIFRAPHHAARGLDLEKNWGISPNRSQFSRYLTGKKCGAGYAASAWRCVPGTDGGRHAHTNLPAFPLSRQGRGAVLLHFSCNDGNREALNLATNPPPLQSVGKTGISRSTLRARRTVSRCNGKRALQRRGRAIGFFQIVIVPTLQASARKSAPDGPFQPSPKKQHPGVRRPRGVAFAAFYCVMLLQLVDVCSAYCTTAWVHER